MSIKDWPADERPREKLLAKGSEVLTDAELLAIFLRTGIAGKSAVDLARDLLDQFGSLQALLKADQQSFCQGKGLGNAKYAQLQAVLDSIELDDSGLASRRPANALANSFPINSITFCRRRKFDLLNEMHRI